MGYTAYTCVYMLVINSRKITWYQYMYNQYIVEFLHLITLLSYKL